MSAMKRTWTAEIEELGYHFGVWSIDLVTVECDVDADPGEPTIRGNPGCPPSCEITDLRVTSVDLVTIVDDPTREVGKIGEGQILDTIKSEVRQHLLDVGWHESEGVRDKCTREVGEQEQADREYAAEAAADAAGES